MQNISNNELINIKNNLDPTKLLSKLIISNCGLQTPPDLKHFGHEFVEVSFDNNAIESFPDGYFEGENLMIRCLYLASNLLSEISRITSLAHSLQWLDLDDNMISSLIDITSVFFPELSDLTIANNRISTIDVTDLVDNWPYILNVDLRFNRIHFLEDMTLLAPMNRQTATDLSFLIQGNPFSCEDELSWLLGREEILFYCKCIDLVDVAEARCHSPAELQGQTFVDIGKP